MSIGDGAGTSISFSQIQAFYGGVSPISISEYNRGGDLVPSNFSGTSTATTGTSSQTVDDFAVTVANDSTSQTISTGANTFTIDTGTGGGSTVTISVTNNNTDEGQATLTRGGSQILSTTGATVTGTVNDGDVLTLSGSGNANPVCSYPRLTRVYDITFQNNNSTGDTYTLTSSATGHSSKSVYAAGDSFLAQNNGSSNQFVIAYDNVSGTGSGTAGDITVTVAAGSPLAGQTTTNPATAPSTSGIIFSTVTATTLHFNNDDNQNVQIFRNGVQVASGGAGSSASASATYNGTIVSGDVFSATGSGSNGTTLRINFTTPTKSIVFTNNTSSDFALGNSTTPGGARVVPANGSSTAQPGGSTANENWVIYFDASSGDCNTNLPTTIGTGNAVNLNLFNAPGTPVG